MAANDKTDVVITNYNRTNTPVFKEGFERYLQDELQRIETTLRTLTKAGIQGLDEPPAQPLKGMVRYAISPWDPLGDGTTGLVVYTGNAWAAV